MLGLLLVVLNSQYVARFLEIILLQAFAAVYANRHHYFQAKHPEDHSVKLQHAERTTFATAMFCLEHCKLWLILPSCL